MQSIFIEPEATTEPNEESGQTKTASGSQFPLSQNKRGMFADDVPEGSKGQGM